MHVTVSQTIGFLSSNYLPTWNSNWRAFIITLICVGTITVSSLAIHYNKKAARPVAIFLIVLAIPIIVNLWFSLIFYYWLGDHSLVSELRNSLSHIGWLVDNLALFMLSLALYLDQYRNKSITTHKVLEGILLILGLHCIYLPRLILNLQSQQNMQAFTDTKRSYFTIFIFIISLMSVVSLITFFIYPNTFKDTPFFSVLAWSGILAFTVNAILFIGFLRNIWLKIFLICMSWLYLAIPLVIFLLILPSKKRTFLKINSAY